MALETDDALFICDADTGLRLLAKELRQARASARELHLFLSHTHWSHVQGRPILLAALAPEQPLRVHASAEDHEILRRFYPQSGWSNSLGSVLD